METPVQITFRDMPGSPALEEKIREHAAKLERYFERITRCRVVVEAPHRHHHKGKIYHVRIDISVPGHELVVNRDPKENHAHEDLYVALSDAFAAAERQVEDFARKIRGD
jgi:ribosomal subunit interface protein